LHDIAKTQELEVGTVGLATAYTTEGQLLGHISMGMAMINNAAKKLNIPRETAMLLEHIMLAHCLSVNSPVFTAERASNISNSRASSVSIAETISASGNKLNIPRETAMLLEHIMLSHHGVPEYGSPQMPMFPEAEIVSAIDTLMRGCLKCLTPFRR